MKKLLCVLMLLLFPLCLSTSADVDEVLGVSSYDEYLGQTVAAGACGDLMTEQTSGSSNAYSSQVDTTQYISTSFTATASGDAKTVKIYISDVGTPPYNLYMWMCADGTDEPSTPTGVSTDCTQSTTTDIGTPGGSYTQVTYAFAGYSITSGNQYYIVVASSTPSIDGSNYYKVQYNNGQSGEDLDRSSDGASWTSTDSSGQWNLKVSSCTE